MNDITKKRLHCNLCPKSYKSIMELYRDTKKPTALLETTIVIFVKRHFKQTQSYICIREDMNRQIFSVINVLKNSSQRGDWQCTPKCILGKRALSVTSALRHSLNLDLWKDMVTCIERGRRVAMFVTKCSVINMI